MTKGVKTILCNMGSRSSCDSPLEQERLSESVHYADINERLSPVMRRTESRSKQVWTRKPRLRV